MAVNGIEIAEGQVWRCRDGVEREVVHNDGHRSYPWDLTDGSVNDQGWEFKEDVKHRRDLIELIRDEYGFTIWKGGPVAPVSGMVEYRLRDGSTFSGVAESLFWGHDGGPVDLVAYKVLTAASVEPQPNNVDADHLTSDLLLDLGWRFDGTTWVQDATAQLEKAVTALDMFAAASAQALAQDAAAPANPLDVQVDGSHYKNLAIQPIEYIHANGIGFAEGSVIKYVTRWRDKNGIKDLEKARHFIDLLIALEQKKEGSK